MPRSLPGRSTRAPGVLEDWVCPHCKFCNWCENTVCDKCHHERHVDADFVFLDLEFPPADGRESRSDRSDEASDANGTLSREAPGTPLPSGWTREVSDAGEVYFVNWEDGSSRWEPPSADSVPSTPQAQSQEGLARLDTAQNGGHETPLWKEIKRAVEVRRIDALIALRAQGVDLRAPCCESGGTPLYWAARAGRLQVAKYLVEDVGAAVDLPNKDGWTPLMVACLTGHRKMAEYLLGRGASVLRRDHDGQTVLHWAAYNGHEDVVRVLLDHGADPFVRESNGMTALELARFAKQTEAAQMLEEAEAAAPGMPPARSGKDGKRPLSGIDFSEAAAGKKGMRDAGLIMSAEGHFVAGHNPTCAEDHLYVPSTGDRGIAVLNRAGALVRYLGALELRDCLGVAVSGALLFASDHRGHRVLALRLTDGSVAHAFGAQSAERGELNSPSGLAASEGLVFVTDTGNDRVCVFDEKGSFVRCFEHEGRGSVAGPLSIAVSGTDAFVADTGNHRIAVFDARSGVFRRSFGSEGGDDGQLRCPTGVCVRDGLAFVADQRNNRVSVFHADDGAHVGHLGDEASTAVPHGVCIADSGLLYVTSRDRVVAFKALKSAELGAAEEESHGSKGGLLRGVGALLWEVAGEVDEAIEEDDEAHIELAVTLAGFGEVAGEISEAAAEALGVIRAVIAVARVIYHMYKRVKANHVRAKTLTERSQAIAIALKNMALHIEQKMKEGDDEELRARYEQLRRVLETMQRAEAAIKNWTELGDGDSFVGRLFAKVKQAIMSHKFAEEFDDVNQELSERLADLHAATSFRSAAVLDEIREALARHAAQDARNAAADMAALPKQLADAADVASSIDAMRSSLAANHTSIEEMRTLLVSNGLDTSLLQAAEARLMGKMESMHVDILEIKRLIAEGHRAVGTTEFRLPYTSLELGDVFREGGFSIVHRGSMDGHPVAVKKFRIPVLAGRDLEIFKREVDIATVVRHPNIVRTYGACFPPDPACIVMDFVPRSLYDALGTLTWAERCRVAHGVASALSHLHRLEPAVLHRDIKSQNVLPAADGTPLLCDFGLAKHKKNMASNKSMQESSGPRGPGAGTRAWQAPEILNYPPQYSAQSDMYAFGMLLFELASGDAPFADAPDEDMVMHWVVKEDRRPAMDPAWNVPDPFVRLMRSCWRAKIEDRPSAEHAKYILKELMRDMSEGV